MVPQVAPRIGRLNLEAVVFKSGGKRASIVFAGALTWAAIGGGVSRAQTVAQSPPKPAAQPAGTVSTPKAATPPGGDVTRGVIFDTGNTKSDWCDVTPPCPKGCRQDGGKNACVEAAKP